MSLFTTLAMSPKSVPAPVLYSRLEKFLVLKLKICVLNFKKI